MVYDGVHFPVFPYPFDLILSVWVLQYMEMERLEKTVSELAQYLRMGGSFTSLSRYRIIQEVSRPRVEDYLQAFKDSKLECLQYYPIRNGRWWLLYWIRYGLIPKTWFPRIAHYELEKRREEKGLTRYYKDFLFLLRKER